MGGEREREMGEGRGWDGIQKNREGEKRGRGWDGIKKEKERGAGREKETEGGKKSTCIQLRCRKAFCAHNFVAILTLHSITTIIIRTIWGYLWFIDLCGSFR